MTEKVFLLYTAALTDFLGLFMKPMPFRPQNGFTAFLIFLLALPVVRALKDFLTEGFLIPIFIAASFQLARNALDYENHLLKAKAIRS